jgi:hypothetical protein
MKHRETQNSSASARKAKDIALRASLLAAAFAIVLSLATVPPPAAYGAEQGAWVAVAVPHYGHPTTGKIEDSGSSKALGQSMCKSALYPKALIEEDGKGNVWATVRLNLMDNIKNVSFKVQKNAKSAFSGASASITQENLAANQRDFRMKIASSKAIVRVAAYVEAMGRNVIFYITFKNLKAGSGDFVTNIAPAKKSTSTSNDGKSTSNKSTSASSGASSANDTSAALATAAGEKSKAEAAFNKDAKTLIAEADGLTGAERTDGTAAPTVSVGSEEGGTQTAFFAWYVAFAAVIFLAGCATGGYYLYVRGVRTGRRIAKRDERNCE